MGLPRENDILGVKLQPNFRMCLLSETKKIEEVLQGIIQFSSQWQRELAVLGGKPRSCWQREAAQGCADDSNRLCCALEG